MADQAINALSTKTAPETSDQLLLVGAGEPQLIDYDKLADAILNKITSKKYALDAGTMTLTAALNALNGNSAKLNDNSESVNKHQNISEIYIYTITIGKLVVLQVSLKIIGDIPSRTKLVTNIPIKSPITNGISATFLDNSSFDKKIFFIDNYGVAAGGICLTNVENLTKGSYRGAIVMITY
jgi:hypothetical protein